MKLQKTLLCGAIAATMLSGCGATEQVKATGADRAPTDKPNVIVVFLDDSGFADISANGGKYNTKNIDKLANEGQNFSSFYVNSSVSSPSRAGMLTSRVSKKTGMYGNKQPVFAIGDPDGLPYEETTIPEMLKTNGYSTMMVGKWHLGLGTDGLEWSPTRHGFDQFWGLVNHNSDTDPEYWPDPKYRMDVILKQINNGVSIAELIPALTFRDGAFADENGRGTAEAFYNEVTESYVNADGTYSDKLLGNLDAKNFTKDATDRVVDYIEEKKDEPFFAYVAYSQTHVPLFVSEDFEGATDTMYGNVMMEIDYNVGRITESLKKNGLEDNTIIVFASDNGPWLPYGDRGAAGDKGSLRDGKGSTYEGGDRVPGIINWPGQIKAGQNDSIFSTLDLMPTLASLTGTEMPDIDTDGYDQSGNLLRGEVSPRGDMGYYFMGHFQAYRNGDYKVVFWKSGLGGSKKLKRTQLFNVKTDPSEVKDLAKKDKAKLKEMIALAKAYDESKGEWATALFDGNSE
ncbi:sulfatase-like hydrolase/transferase [Photobacterium sagamiensis]|uniref:sulfatase-like hydrolase/transferase n=1 Tax=Photobacterium sagamiensis TaxID=2910241 RepID=UPI003D13D08D